MSGLSKSVLLIAVLMTATAGASDWTLRVDIEGHRVEGKPLSWSDAYVHVLSRSGQLWSFPPEEASNFQRVSSSFRTYSQSELRRQLLNEFGRQFEVSGTGQFLVVHPKGQRDLWAQRFEELYRSFVHYFSVRGFRPRAPTFPFIAVVFHRQADFMKYSASTGARIGSGVLGYYSPTTNRILLYDQARGGHPLAWQENADTIIHEAAHQSAFNTGIHSRFAPPPRWVVEGLGTMFEARGVWDSSRYTRQTDRINYGRLREFKGYAATRRRKGVLAELVSSDRLFGADPSGAYAESWALTFYLVETQPRKYFEYLAKTASRSLFSEYRTQDRMSDFTSVFGQNLTMLDARLQRFFEELE